MFDLLIIKPIFNLLVFVYALLPGHNFGLALIVFTVIVRLLMWPLVKKQLHHTKAMRKLQPEVKRIKQAAKGNRQQESIMIMALYKERQISPFGSIGIIIVQFIILIGLYSGLSRLIASPDTILNFSYGWLRDFGWLKELAGDISKFDNTLLGAVDLTKSALPKGEGIYWPAMILVLGSAVSQYYQSKQLMPDDGETRSLRKILKDAGSGREADQSEVQAATGRSMRYLIPGLIFIFTVGLPSALALYWFVTGIVAYIQQDRVLKQDETELEALSGTTITKKHIIEGEVIKKKQGTGNNSDDRKAVSEPRSKHRGKKKKPAAKNKRRKK